MIRKLAITSGFIFLFLGFLGFIPVMAPNEHLPGIFHVNAAHNAVHLPSGAVAVACGLASAPASRLFFRVFGVVYGLVALLGFFAGNEPILGIISNNTADTVLHALIAAASLVFGFALKETPGELAARTA